jgi:hypothetical protein
MRRSGRGTLPRRPCPRCEPRAACSASPPPRTLLLRLRTLSPIRLGRRPFQVFPTPLSEERQLLLEDTAEDTTKERAKTGLPGRVKHSLVLQKSNGLVNQHGPLAGRALLKPTISKRRNQSHSRTGPKAYNKGEPDVQLRSGAAFSRVSRAGMAMSSDRQKKSSVAGAF